MNPRTSNIGICVRDLERSVAFYCAALGFRRSAPFTIGSELAEFTELPDSKLTMQFVSNGHYEIELLQVHTPGPVGDGATRPINTLGDVHLAFQVDDIDTTMALVERHGGNASRHTRMALDLGDGEPGEYVFCFDPDGVRIELLTKEMEKVYE
jgi:catechol 2,3-dioxygenase-like lactoylglutathione lyase family enzyme